MSWYGKRLPNFVSATTEARLRDELAKISIQLGEKLEVMTIYPRGGRLYAWYFLDITKRSALPESEVEEKTKKVKKKISKKKASKKAGS